MELCKACGLPAWEQTSQPVPYCGEKKCLTQLLNVCKPAENKGVNLIPGPFRVIPIHSKHAAHGEAGWDEAYARWVQNDEIPESMRRYFPDMC